MTKKMPCVTCKHAKTFHQKSGCKHGTCSCKEFKLEIRLNNIVINEIEEDFFLKGAGKAEN